MAQASYNAATLFTLNAGGYTAGAQQIVRANRSISASQSSVAQSSAQMGGRMSKATAFISQAGFGIEDFALGFQTGGLQGAMRGASNNLSMMAMAVGGLTGALGALGMTVATQVLPQLSKMAQSTSAFRGLGDAIADYNSRLEASSHNRSLQRQAAMAKHSFDQITDSASALRRIDDQKVDLGLAQDEVSAAKKDLQDLKELRNALIRADKDEASKHSTIRKFAAGFTPYLADAWAANVGDKKAGLWNNTKEIVDGFKPLERDLELRLRRAEQAESSSRNILNSMQGKAPEILEKEKWGELTQMRQKFEDATRQGLGWSAAYDREVAAIKDKAFQDAEEIRRLISNPRDQRDMIAQVERNRDTQLELAADVFNHRINERLKEAEEGLLDPLEKRLSDINQQADQLRAEVENVPASDEERAAMQRRIDKWRDGAEQQARKEAAAGGRESSLQSIMAGSDKVFATVRQQEVDLLKKIADNTDANRLSIASMV